MFKKIIVFFLFFLMFWKTFAVNWDDVINNYVAIPISWDSDYVIPIWYDLFVQNANIIVPLQVNPSDTIELEVYDWVILKFQWEFIEWSHLGTYNMVFRDNLEIFNLWDTEDWIIYNWYLFLEGTEVDIIPGNDFIEPIASESFYAYWFSALTTFILIFLTIVFIIRLLNIWKFNLFNKIFLWRK